MSDIETYDNLVYYLSDMDECSSSCIFYEDCPVSLDGTRLNTCLIKRDKTYDVFYNLFVNTKKGIDAEIKNALYKMSRDAITTGDNKDYLNNLVKVKSAFYGPDKNKDVEEITAINIEITPVGDPVQQTSEPQVSEEARPKRNTNSKKRNTEDGVRSTKHKGCTVYR